MLKFIDVIFNALLFSFGTHKKTGWGGGGFCVCVCGGSGGGGGGVVN